MQGWSGRMTDAGFRGGWEIAQKEGARKTLSHTLEKEKRSSFGSRQIQLLHRLGWRGEYGWVS